MSLEVKCSCCGEEIASGDYIYDEACYNKQEQRIEELREEVDDKDDTISSLEKVIERLEAKIKELEWKKETIKSTEKVDNTIADGLKTDGGSPCN